MPHDHPMTDPAHPPSPASERDTAPERDTPEAVEALAEKAALLNKLYPAFVPFGEDAAAALRRYAALLRADLPAAPGWRAKGLEWHRDSSGVWCAATPMGLYQADERDGWAFARTYSPPTGGVSDDPKAAAQADFASRLAACIETDPSEAGWRDPAGDICYLLSIIDTLEEATGEGPDPEDRALVEEIRRDYLPPPASPEPQTAPASEDVRAARFVSDDPEQPCLWPDCGGHCLGCEPAPASDPVRSAAEAGWNACRKSIYAVCEDVGREAEEAGKHSGEHAQGYSAGMARAAKSIARGFNSMEAEDDDHFRAVLAALAQNGGGGCKTCDGRKYVTAGDYPGADLLDCPDCSAGASDAWRLALAQNGGEERHG